MLLEAEVVCATLSGSGSQHLAETVLLSAQMKAEGSKKGKMKRWQGDINTTLNFDAVVMVRLTLSVLGTSSRANSALNASAWVERCNQSSLFLCGIFLQVVYGTKASHH